MNAVEIEVAVSALASQPSDAAEFPYAFRAAFGNKENTIKRLRKGESNASDAPGGVLQRNNIHIAVAEPGMVGETLQAPRKSPKTSLAKAKFILATDAECWRPKTWPAAKRSYRITAVSPDMNHFMARQASIAAKQISIPYGDARTGAAGIAVKRERGRVPDINSQDAWDRLMAEGVAAFARHRAQQQAHTGVDRPE